MGVCGSHDLMFSVHSEYSCGIVSLLCFGCHCSISVVSQRVQLILVQNDSTFQTFHSVTASPISGNSSRSDTVVFYVALRHLITVHLQLFRNRCTSNYNNFLCCSLCTRLYMIFCSRNMAKSLMWK